MITTFAKLNIGDKFVFVDERPVFNRQYGPFVKATTKKYRATDGITCPPSSQGTRVTKVD